MDFVERDLQSDGAVADPFFDDGTGVGEGGMVE